MVLSWDVNTTASCHISRFTVNSLKDGMVRIEDLLLIRFPIRNISRVDCSLRRRRLVCPRKINFPVLLQMLESTNQRRLLESRLRHQRPLQATTALPVGQLPSSIFQHLHQILTVARCQHHRPQAWPLPLHQSTHRVIHGHRNQVKNIKI